MLSLLMLRISFFLFNLYVFVITDFKKGLQVSIGWIQLAQRMQGKKGVKKETGLGLTYKKDENFGEWYSEAFFDVEIKKLDVESA
ncbi:proline--tRNA ligase, cytoplasmic-like [Phalaenopsis equestris]|uniref:proline--tRNA ligase, cytoplasmic-like n=1 Tax=Phalaenopsis equestris TaxID=78828 RepID=UPI0009E27220|nr:proline--tRNA ligase, cytoplasmic-like [Phalaenopsis equestris]